MARQRARAEMVVPSAARRENAGSVSACAEPPHYPFCARNVRPAPESRSAARLPMLGWSPMGVSRVQLLPHDVKKALELLREDSARGGGVDALAAACGVGR